MGSINQNFPRTMIPSKPYTAAKRDRKKDFKKLSYALSRQMLTAILTELKMPTLNTPGGSAFHRRSAAGRNE